MTIKREILNVIKKNLANVIENRDKKYASGLSSLYIAVDKGSGEISFNDENENTLREVVVFDWIGKHDELSDEIIIQALRNTIQMASSENVFDSTNIYKPFTIYYTDDSNTVIEELITIDGNEYDDVDSDMGEDILAKLDREFDEFLEKLLKD